MNAFQQFPHTPYGTKSFYFDENETRYNALTSPTSLPTDSSLYCDNTIGMNDASFSLDKRPLFTISWDSILFNPSDSIDSASVVGLDFPALEDLNVLPSQYSPRIIPLSEVATDELLEQPVQVNPLTIDVSKGERPYHFFKKRRLSEEESQFEKKRKVESTRVEIEKVETIIRVRPVYYPGGKGIPYHYAQLNNMINIEEEEESEEDDEDEEDSDESEDEEKDDEEDDEEEETEEEEEL